MNYETTFLVVGNMEGMRRILSNILKQLGMRNIILSNNGANAWHILQTQTVDVVLSDWKMFGLSGHDLLHKIRASTRLAQLPVLMMGAEEDQVSIEAMGAHYVVKPFNMLMLESKIKAIAQSLGSRPPASAPPAPPVPAVRLPIAAAKQAGTGAADTSASAPRQEAAPDKPTLLVVDDLTDNLDILVDLLSDHYVVRAASSGERALKILSVGALPELILLDVMMPEMDGFEVCRRIKINPATAHIPVIFLSTMTESVDLAKGFEVGAVDFITKPADPPILRARIATHIKLLRAFANLQQSQVAVIAQNAMLEENLRLHEEVERIAQHDLKNPIACIIGFASILQDDEQLSQDNKDIVSYIEQSAYSALNMVNLSLDLYKMEQGSYLFHPVEVDVARLLQRIVKEKSPEMASRKLDVQIVADLGQRAGMLAPLTGPTPALPPILGDELLCYSMLSNILKNALEAASAHSVIQIELQVQGPLFSIHISNDGVVPAEIRARFFDKFSTAGKPGGTGLGTFSARLIARTQGGDMCMQTCDIRQRTTISIMLPCVVANDPGKTGGC